MSLELGGNGHISLQSVHGYARSFSGDDESDDMIGIILEVVCNE